MAARRSIKTKKRWIVKVGSALLTNDGQSLDTQMIRNLANQICVLRERNIEVILVSSGSVAAGMNTLGMPHRPERIDELQAAAAVGQASLIRQYEQAFSPFSIKIAQVLLTHADIANRERYLNARNTFATLLKLDVLAVVNENDTVATEEICFGDNDNLAALVANLVEADLLVILTDQDGVFTADPRNDATAKLLLEISSDDPALSKMTSGSVGLGRGGMVTKITAAQNASRSGAATIVANGRTENILIDLYDGRPAGTLLPAKQRLASKKQWLAGQMRIKGSVIIDAGAVKVLQKSGSSLLPIGVTMTNGEFSRGELIHCLDENGLEIARGLSNYSASEVNKIKGLACSQINETLGYPGNDELIHRDNMVVL